jgi:uncharacterized protein YjiS (DUF1127 family)
MNAQSINADQTDFNSELATPATTYPVSLLAGFIRHYQDARRIQQEARRLYAMSDADLDGMGISREDIPAQLASLYSR